MNVFVIVINLKWFIFDSIKKHDKIHKLEQRKSNYVQLINELKPKMEVSLSQTNIDIIQRTSVILMLLSRS